MQRLGSYITRSVYTVSGPFHPFGGAVDIIVVEQPDGSFKSSPWYVRFGKFQGVLKARERVVNISVNGVDANFHMYLDPRGEAYFLREVDGDEGESVSSSSGDETDESQSQNNRRPMKSKSLVYKLNSGDHIDAANGKIVARTNSGDHIDAANGKIVARTNSGDHIDAANGKIVASTNSGDHIDAANGKIVARTNSRRSRIFGLVFGRRSMKEDGYGDGGNINGFSDGMERINSLERAEIAANLLDVQWSTNLATSNSKKDNALNLSASITSDGEGPKGDSGKLTNDEQSQLGSFEQDASETTVGHFMSTQETDSCNVQIDNNFPSAFENQEVSVKKTSVEIPSSCAAEQIVETFILGDIIAGEKLQGTSELSINTDEPGLQDTNRDGMEGIISKISITDAQITGTFEAFPNKEFNEEWQSEETVAVPVVGLSKDEGEPNIIQSYIYHENSENLLMELDDLEKQLEETLYTTNGGPEDVHFCAETLHVATELLPEGIIAQQCQEIELERVHIESCDNFVQQTNPSPPSVCDHEVNLDIPGASLKCCSKMARVEPILGTEAELNSNCFTSSSSNPDYQIQHQVNNGNKIINNELQPALESVGGGSELILGTEAELKGKSSIHSFSNSDYQIQDQMDGDKILRNELQHALESVGGQQQLNDDPDLAKADGIPVSESSEDEQFLFSDLENFKYREIQAESNFPDGLSKENQGTNEVDRCLERNNESFSQENQLADIDNLSSNSKAASSPIYIPKLHSIIDVEVGRTESLPNMRSCINELGAEDSCRTLSHSLDSDSKSLKWKLDKKDEACHINSVPNVEDQSSLEYSNNKDFHHSEDMRNGVPKPSIEISLCKHLLYEGMGAEAASQAFDAEKLGIDKFKSIGPEVVKNDKLVVRIGGHYFPWDAAAPIVLGMVAFGSEITFEPKGRIPVDQVEKSLVGDPSKAIVTPGGSWRLWPFSFRRSRSRKTMQSTPNDSRSSGAGNTSDSNIGLDSDKNHVKPRVTKKKVRAITPMSEELASLNLKEGSNVVTFTFSTAMLGRQKVDARIYLWKWNTRIVISDVDGTITKSDVLGQFMPLVGMDWSQTGVAPLFSAIKENGYQLLFLSARAISQAYITRQFLVNLKQDGKALPDGPVVISPDGLFPSLFREVIRRAPHEFKIACLEDIKALFPPDYNPFYAGFGNRDTDEISYLKVGIPKGKIFIINPKGEVAVNRRVDTKSYTSIHTLVHGMFPAMTSSEQEDFNSWNYWRLPPPVIDI